MYHRISILQLHYHPIQTRNATTAEISGDNSRAYRFDLHFEKIDIQTIVTVSGEFFFFFPEAKKTTVVKGSSSFKLSCEIKHFYSPSDIYLKELVELCVNFYAQSRGFAYWHLQTKDYFHIERIPFVSIEEVEEAINLLYLDGYVEFE